MHSSRHLEKMHPKSKFRDGAPPISKKPTRFDYDEPQDDQVTEEPVPYWEEEKLETNV